MVLPPPAADAGAAEAQAWLGKLIRDLELARRGILFALTDATPTQLGPVVRALSKAPPWSSDDEGVLEVCLRGPDIAGKKRGSTVLLRVREEDLEWLNVYRPMFADLELRAILWADGETYDAMVRRAVDLASWVSRDVAVPPKPVPDFAVAGVRAALNAGVPFCWRGANLRESVQAAGWSEEVLELDVDVQYRELLETLRTPGLPVVAGIRSERDAWRIRMALAQVNRSGTWVARDPKGNLIGMWHLHAEQTEWDRAAEQLRAAGWRRPELMAAWVDLEPEAIAEAIVRVEQAPHTAQEFAADAIVKAEAPSSILRTRMGDEDIAVARARIQQGKCPTDDAGRVCWAEGREAWTDGEEGSEARMVRALRDLGEGVPCKELIDAVAQAGFVDVAMELARVRWEAREDSRADGLVQLLMERGDVATAARIAEEWRARAESSKDQPSIAAACSWLGEIQFVLGHGELALRHLEDSLAIILQLRGGNPDRSDVQLGLAVLYNKLGDLHRKLGHGELALRYFEDSLAIVRQLVAREPDRSDLQNSLTVSFDRLGDLHRKLGHGELARRYFEDSLAITRQLVAHEPDRADFQRNLSVSFERLGDLHRDLGQADLALRYFEESLAIVRQLVEREPGRSDLQTDLFAAYTHLGDLHCDLGHAELALRYFEDSLAIVQRLVAREPERSDLQRDLSVSYNKLGDLHRELGHEELALRYFEDSLAIDRQLVAREPGRSDLQRDLSISYNKLGDIHRDLGHAEIALRYFESALAIRKQLVVGEPGRADLQRDLSVSLGRLSVLHRDLGNDELALRYLEDSLAIDRQLVEREPDRSDLQHDLSISLQRMGDLHRARGNDELALRYFEDSLALARQIVDREPNRVDFQRGLALLFEHMAGVDSEHATDWLARSLAMRRSICEQDPMNAIAKRGLGVALIQIADATGSREALHEGYELLHELKSQGKLEARYHSLVDRLTQHLTSTQP